MPVSVVGLLAADPRTAVSFHEICLDFIAGHRGDRAADALAVGLSRNRALSTEHVARLLRLRPAKALPGLLTRDGVTAADAVTLLGATRSLPILRLALEAVPDPDGVLGRHVLSRNPNRVLRLDLARLAENVALRMEQVPWISVGDVPRYLSRADLFTLQGFLARTPGGRTAHSSRLPHIPAGSQLPELDSPPRREPRRVDPPVAFERWLLGTVTAADVVCVLEAAAAQPTLPFGTPLPVLPALNDLWAMAVRVVPDPDGFLLAAALRVGGARIEAAVLAGTHLPVASRRSAALGAAEGAAPGALAAESVTALAGLVRGAPLDWLTRVVGVVPGVAVARAVLAEPGMGGPGPLEVAHTRLRRSGLGGEDRYRWALWLVDHPDASPGMRWWANRTFEERELASSYSRPGADVARRFWGDVADGIGDGRPGTGAWALSRLPLPGWSTILATTAAAQAMQTWIHGAVTALLPAVAEPDTARALLSLAAGQVFTGSLTELATTAAAVAGRTAAPVMP
jgi:hypothetical protein